MPPVREQVEPDTVPGDEVQVRFGPQTELGVSGLRRAHGTVDEEFLPQLRGRRAVQIFREMSDNDPTVGALIFSIDRLLRNIDWNVVPADDTPASKLDQQFVEECMQDMSSSWSDFISEVCSMLIYGFSWHEIVYKKRIGPWETNPTRRSKYTDGKIGWRKMPMRAQETMQRWVFDQDGGIQAFVQLAPPLYQRVVIPVQKSLLFRTSTVKQNPEGRSILRNAYRPWYLKKRIEEHEAVGVERDLTGMPVFGLPADFLSAKQGTKEWEVVQAAKKMVKGVRRDELEGVLKPIQYDPDKGNELFTFELMSSGGTRQFDTDRIIRRYQQDMLICVLADFILVGHQDTGSYALHTDKTGLFRTAINSFAQAIADVLNRHAIPRLFSINGMKPEQLPQFKPGEVDPPDLAQLSAFIGSMSSAGMTFFPDPELEKFARRAAKLPELTEQQEAVREAEARQDEIMRLAQRRMEMLSMAQGAESQAMGMEGQKQEMSVNRPEAMALREKQDHERKGKFDKEDHEQGMKFKEKEHAQTMRHKEDDAKQKIRITESQKRYMQKFKESKKAGGVK